MTTECKVVESKRTIMELCEGKNSCQIQALDSLFGDDPCPETTKYVKVSYTCEKRE